jgi:cytochrome c551/c552
MRRRASISIVISIAAAVFLGSGAASASKAYPEAMKTALVLAKAPSCDLCHAAAADPVGPASTPFGKSMIAKGLLADDPASLTKALDGLRAAGVDSDGDGAEDLDELSWGGDPNHADVPESGNTDPVTYGCSAGRVPVEGGGAGLLFGAIALLAARRRRRSQP